MLTQYFKGIQLNQSIKSGVFLIISFFFLSNAYTQVPPTPATVFCGAIVNPGNNITPNVSSGEGYRWEVRDAENDTLVGVYDGIHAGTFSPTRNVFHFRFNWLKSAPYAIDYTIGMTYKVRVARRVGGVWGEYGASCEMIPATNVWDGSVSTDWNNASNWTGGVPNGNSFTYIRNVSRKPVISGTMNVRNLSFESVNAKITVNEGSKLVINRAINSSMSGVIIANGEIEFTSRMDLLPTNFVNSKIHKLSINTGTGSHITLKGNLTVDELHFENGSLFIGNSTSNQTLTINGKMTRAAANTTNGIRGYTSVDGVHNFGNLIINSNESTPLFIEQNGGGNPTNIFQSVTFNTNHEIELVGSMRVRNLTLTNGKIISTPSNLLEIGILSPVSDAGNVAYSNGFVQGPVKKWFDASGQEALMPVGENGFNKNVKIQFSGFTIGGMQGYVIASFVKGSPERNYDDDLPLQYLEGNKRKYIQNVNDEGYWDITPYSIHDVPYGALNAQNYTIKLRLNHPPSTAENPITDGNNLKIIKSTFSGGAHQNWEVLDASLAQTIESGYDYELAVQNVLGFSHFNIGGNNEEPLPVELTKFDGFCSDLDEKTIRWSTASENNSDYFEIYKSNDGTNWNRFSKVKAAGFSQSNIDYSVIDPSGESAYYALHQFDFNGDFEIFPAIHVQNCTHQNWIVSPNPFEHYIRIHANDVHGKASITLINQAGNVIYASQKEALDTFFTLDVPTDNLSKGMYFVSIQQETKTEVVKVIKF
jgi:hypothetical protein